MLGNLKVGYEFLNYANYVKTVSSKKCFLLRAFSAYEFEKQLVPLCGGASIEEVSQVFSQISSAIYIILFKSVSGRQMQPNSRPMIYPKHGEHGNSKVPTYISRIYF